MYLGHKLQNYPTHYSTYNKAAKDAAELGQGDDDWSYVVLEQTNHYLIAVYDENNNFVEFWGTVS